MTKEQAYDVCEQFKSKKARLEAVKEQILIRYLGLGWVEAHHPWSEKRGVSRYTFLPCELLEHFVKVVLPLADSNTVPSKPPVKLPGLPKLYRLGTRAQDCIDLDNKLSEVSRDFRLKAMKQREQLEDDGYGDELYEMQQNLWPVKALREENFSIDKLFEYKVGDQLTLQWCQGKVKKFLSERKDTHIIVQIEWNNKCLRDGDPKISREKLTRTAWNPKKQAAGAWRQDLYHKILKMR